MSSIQPWGSPHSPTGIPNSTNWQTQASGGQNGKLRRNQKEFCQFLVIFQYIIKRAKILSISAQILRRSYNQVILNSDTNKRLPHIQFPSLDIQYYPVTPKHILYFPVLSGNLMYTRPLIPRATIQAIQFT